MTATGRPALCGPHRRLHRLSAQDLFSQRAARGGQDSPRERGLSVSYVRTSYTYLHVGAGASWVLVDMGLGNLSPYTGKLVDNMRAAGIDMLTIDTVPITFAHGDHMPIVSIAVEGPAMNCTYRRLSGAERFRGRTLVRRQHPSLDGCAPGQNPVSWSQVGGNGVPTAPRLSQRRKGSTPGSVEEEVEDDDNTEFDPLGKGVDLGRAPCACLATGHERAV
jgi:glyoxylase-like metal-dependent hydrolase (beta-lactamase superfamily II)